MYLPQVLACLRNRYFVDALSHSASVQQEVILFAWLRHLFRENEPKYGWWI